MSSNNSLPEEVAANVRAARNALRNGLYPRKCTIRGLLSALDSQARRLAELENPVTFFCVHCRAEFPASADGLKEGMEHDLTCPNNPLVRRLAEVEAENGRFAGMLEDSVSGWRKLYTEERAERVRIEGVLLNDVQAERQESDEHINGLNVVIKTQDKTIRDLKSRVAELEAHICHICVDIEDIEAERDKYQRAYCAEDKARMQLLAEYDELGITLERRAEAAEARVRELEAEAVGLHEEISQRVKAAIHAESREDKAVRRADKAEARVRELEAKKDAAFWQGWALLAGFITGSHDEQSLVEEAAREHGVTLALLEASSCDEFELEPLRRKVFMSAALAATEVPNA
jgi:DNA-binding transcriptional MerR regulator